MNGQCLSVAVYRQHIPNIHKNHHLTSSNPEFLNCVIGVSIYTANSIGDKMPPYRTPAKICEPA